MGIRHLFVAVALTAAPVLSLVPGCAVSRGQETVGNYIDDAAITAAVKAKFVEDKTVDAAAIHVETLQGTVMLSGFARNVEERNTAEHIAREAKGVKSVRNAIVIRQG